MLPIHVAIFKEVKYTEWKHYKVQNDITEVLEPIHIYKIKIIKTHTLKYVNISYWYEEMY